MTAVIKARTSWQASPWGLPQALALDNWQDFSEYKWQAGRESEGKGRAWVGGFILWLRVTAKGADGWQVPAPSPCFPNCSKWSLLNLCLYLRQESRTAQQKVPPWQAPRNALIRTSFLIENLRLKSSPSAFKQEVHLHNSHRKRSWEA